MAGAWAWTSSQRKVLIGLVLALAAWLGIRLWLNPLYVSDPQPDRPPRYDELADRIDPNTADEAALAALPVIGPKKAAEIVRYREQFARDGRGDRAFAAPEDLLRVSGIGPAVLSAMRPYLEFPADRSATAPRSESPGL